MRTKRIELILALHGKLARDGKLGVPEIDDILEKRLECHRTFQGRGIEIQCRWPQREGMGTEVVSVSAIESEEIAGCDSARDRDLYESHLAEERYDQAG